MPWPPTLREYAPSRALLDAAHDDPGATLYVTSQILCEFYSVVTNPRRVALARSTKFLTVLPIPARAVEGWMDLLRRRPVTGADVLFAARDDYAGERCLAHAITKCPTPACQSTEVEAVNRSDAAMRRQRKSRKHKHGNVIQMRLLRVVATALFSFGVAGQLAANTNHALRITTS
jgi:hypothetical protein